jgi:hypothetical protein
MSDVPAIEITPAPAVEPKPKAATNAKRRPRESTTSESTANKKSRLQPEAENTTEKVVISVTEYPQTKPTPEPKMKVYVAILPTESKTRVAVVQAENEKSASHLLNTKLVNGLKSLRQKKYEFVEIPRNKGEFVAVTELVHIPFQFRASSDLSQILQVYCSEFHGGEMTDDFNNKAIIVAANSTRARELLDEKLNDLGLCTSKQSHYALRVITKNENEEVVMIVGK